MNTLFDPPRALSDKITICIFAFNEERRLARCIRNFSGLFEVLVIDNFSTDQTREVATSNGCRCISIKNPGFVETTEVMDRVQEAVTTEYMLMAFTSEFFPFPLLKRFAQIADTGSVDVVYAYRFPITAGKPMQLDGKSFRSKGGQLRLFKKHSVDYSNNRVHDVGRPACGPDRVLSLVANRKLQFYTFRDYDISRTEKTHCTYNDILAQQQHESGMRFSLSRALVAGTKAFVSAYFGAACFRFGILGLVHSFYRAHMVWGIWFRLWELENGYDMAGAVTRNATVRTEYEREFDSERKLQGR